MLTYNEIFNQVEQLKPDEQLRLLEDLAMLVRRQVIMTTQEQHQMQQDRDLDRWFGFLPQPIDALEFQLSIRQEWNRTMVIPRTQKLSD